MPPNLGSAPGIPPNTFLLGTFTQGVPTTFLPQGPLTLETFRHTSILRPKSPPCTSLGSRQQEWQSGIRAEVTYLMSFSLQDCQLQEERAWAGPRAGAPPTAPACYHHTSSFLLHGDKAASSPSFPTWFGYSCY